MVDVEVENFHCNYLFSKGEKDPNTLQQRLDSIAHHLLEETIERFLPSSLRTDNILFLINDLKITFPIKGRKFNDNKIAALWGKQITSAIAKAIADPSDRNNIILYSSQAEFVVNFIVDIIKGTAWTKWQYQSFEHLKKFDTRGLIKEILQQNREIAEDVFMLFAGMNSLGDLLGELNEGDVEYIFNDFLAIQVKSGSKKNNELFRVLAYVLDHNVLELRGEKFLSFKNYFTLYIQTIHKHPEFRAVPQLKKAVRLTFLLKDFLRTYNGSDALAKSIATTTDKRFAELHGLWQEVIGNGREEVVAEIVSQISGKEKVSKTERIITPYGGLFLLIRSILDKGLDLLIQNSSFPAKDNLPKLKVMLLFLARKISGFDVFIFEGFDPGPLFFAGFRDPPVPSLLKEFIEAVTPEMNSNFQTALLNSFPHEKETLLSLVPQDKKQVNLESTLNVLTALLFKFFAARLRRFENSKPEYIFANFLHRPAELILEDDCVTVKLSKKPLDIILNMSGYIEEIRGVHWLDNRSIKFILANS